MEEKYLHNLEAVPLSEIVKKEYRDYQIYTLMDRAIPYLQDGLKPVQRRILYTLWKNQNKGLMKVSAATGLVLTLHPHGPQSIEAAITNLAQDYTFSNNYPLIDKKGYFGERMETTPAASRYIECRLGKVAEILLFDDMNQVPLIPNYDEKSMEPLAMFPKLPIELLNGAEGIGTGFSSVIPSFHHKDVVESLIYYLDKGKAKKMTPYFHYFSQKTDVDSEGKLIFNLKIEQIGEDFYITEVPRGYDAQKIYRFLNKHIDNGYIKDFIDSSVNNDIKIELVFKRGEEHTLEEVREKLKCQSSLVPNYTLISEKGVKIFNTPEEIIEIFAEVRRDVVRKRYEILAHDYEEKIRQNDEIIRFIKQKHYEVAIKTKNRKEYVEYLTKKKFTFSDYLADMAIYRMTKEEVNKRHLMIEEDTEQMKMCQKVCKSPALVQKKLIEELEEVREKLTEWLKDRDLEKIKQMRDLEKKKRRPKGIQ
ncbi:MAG: DNA gyrase subunit A [Pseudomonadota bacterium]